jgi:hypothetical protein
MGCAAFRVIFNNIGLCGLELLFMTKNNFRAMIDTYTSGN